LFKLAVIVIVSLVAVATIITNTDIFGSDVIFGQCSVSALNQKRGCLASSVSSSVDENQCK